MFDKTAELLQQREVSKWDLADTLVREMRGATWADLAVALDGRGIEYKMSTMRAYARIAKAFPHGERVAGVSFAAHQAALTAGDSTAARAAINAAQGNGGRATRDTVLAEVRKMKGRTTQQTSDAVTAWRDLRRGVDRLLDLDAPELEALLLLADGKYAGEAANLSRDLGKVSVKISEAMKKAQVVLTKRQAKATARVAKVATPKASTKAAAKAKTEAAAQRKPRVGKLGAGRGQG